MDQMLCKKVIFLLLTLVVVLLDRADPVGQLVRGSYKKHLCKIILHLDQWFR